MMPRTDAGSVQYRQQPHVLVAACARSHTSKKSCIVLLTDFGNSSSSKSLDLVQVVRKGY